MFAIDEFARRSLIGDVGGKGIRQAAGLTETVHTAVNSYALVDTSPAFILRKTNELLLRSSVDEQFVTAFLFIVDLRTGRRAARAPGIRRPLSPVSRHVP